MDNGSSFLRNSTGLTRNPLGIIALFISLIYGFACLVLSTSIDNLRSNCERLPLIWFIILFPVVILIAFIYLVINHHEKLYAPSDFREDDSFIQTIDEKKVKKKQLQELKELESSEPTNSKDIVEHQTSKPDIENKKQESTASMTEEAKAIDTTDATVEKSSSKSEKLLEIYSNAEKWVAQELGLKYKLLFKTNVALKNDNYGRYELDALGRDIKRTYVIETKYWTSDKSEKKLKLSIQEFLGNRQKLEAILRRPGVEFRIVIAIVFDSLKNVNQGEFVNFVTSISPSTIVEFFEYDELKRHYE